MKSKTQLINAYIDLRFDYADDPVDKNGHIIGSFEQITLLINQLKEIGFNSVSLAVQVPLDLQTGEIRLGSFATKDNKNLPIDLWEIIDYAHSLGLSVNLRALPSVVYFSDGAVDNGDSDLNISLSLGQGVTHQKLFESISNYQKKIALLAEKHHVEILSIGNSNWGYDTQDFLQYWQKNIEEIRSVYSGKLSYQSYWDNAIWGLVDIIELQLNPLVSKTPIYDLAEIIQSWQHVNGGVGQNNTNNFIKLIEDISRKYSDKAIFLNDYSQYAFNPGIGDTIVPFNFIFNNQDISLLPAPDYKQQALAYQAFIYISKYLVEENIDGFGVTEFTPWLQASWIEQVPIFKWVNTVGNNIWEKNEVLEKIQQTLLKNPLPNHFFSSPSNESFSGNINDIDTLVFFGSFLESQLNIDAKALSSVSNLFDGTDQLTNIERLQFSDISLALDIGPNENAGSVYMLYKAAFNRTPDAVGMGYWIAQKDGGANIVTSIAQGFVNSAEFIAKYGANPTNASYVNNLYQNVLGRAGEAGGVAYWTGEMDAGRVNKAQALVQFATLPEGASLVAPLIANGIQYQEWLG